MTQAETVEKILMQMGSDQRYVEAIEVVERTVYALRPSVLAADELPGLSGSARRLVALVLTQWQVELEAGCERVLNALGPESLGVLAELASEERERALRALFDRWVRAPAGPIVPWTAIASVFGSLLDDDRRAAEQALEAVAPVS